MAVVEAAGGEGSEGGTPRVEGSPIPGPMSKDALKMSSPELATRTPSGSQGVATPYGVALPRSYAPTRGSPAKAASSTPPPSSPRPARRRSWGGRIVAAFKSSPFAGNTLTSIRHSFIASGADPKALEADREQFQGTMIHAEEAGRVAREELCSKLALFERCWERHRYHLALGDFLELLRLVDDGVYQADAHRAQFVRSQTIVRPFGVHESLLEADRRLNGVIEAYDKARLVPAVYALSEPHCLAFLLGKFDIILKHPDQMQVTPVDLTHLQSTVNRCQDTLARMEVLNYPVTSTALEDFAQTDYEYRPTEMLGCAMLRQGLLTFGMSCVDFMKGCELMGKNAAFATYAAGLKRATLSTEVEAEIGHLGLDNVMIMAILVMYLDPNFPKLPPASQTALLLSVGLTSAHLPQARRMLCGRMAGKMKERHYDVLDATTKASSDQAAKKYLKLIGLGEEQIKCAGGTAVPELSTLFSTLAFYA